MQIDQLSKGLTIAKDVVVVLAIAFVGWRYVPLVFDQSLTEGYEISEINLLVMKLVPTASERALTAAPGGGDATASEPAETSSSPETAATRPTVTFYAQQSQGSGQNVAVVVPTRNVVGPSLAPATIAKRASGYCFVGTHRDGAYSGLNFRVDPALAPAELAKQSIRATTDVFIRDDKPRFLLGWTMGERVGVLATGTEVVVEEVFLIPAKGGGSRVWVRI